MKLGNYVGLYEDEYGGMTHMGRVIRDAWVFGILPETEHCAGWTPADMQNLYEKVHAAWDRFGHIPSKLAADLQEKYMRINEDAIIRARSLGWNPELGEDD
jgi:hypothetical protein